MNKKVQYFVPALIALSAACLYLSILRHAPAQLPAQVELGKDYYVSAVLVELKERDAAGEPWDGYNETGPDIYYEIAWKGTRIFRSTSKDDTFVAKWSNAELNVARMALQGATSLETLVQAARINIKNNETIEVEVFDADAVQDDLAGKKSFETTELKVGDTTYEFSDTGIKRLILRVSDMTQPPDVSR